MAELEAQILILRVQRIVMKSRRQKATDVSPSLDEGFGDPCDGPSNADEAAPKIDLSETGSSRSR